MRNPVLIEVGYCWLKSAEDALKCQAAGGLGGKEENGTARGWERELI